MMTSETESLKRTNTALTTLTSPWNVGLFGGDLKVVYFICEEHKTEHVRLGFLESCPGYTQTQQAKHEPSAPP